MRKPRAPAPSPVKQVLKFGEEGTNPGQLTHPTDLAVASDGSIVVAEGRSGRVQRFAADGTWVVSLPVRGSRLALDRSGKLYALEGAQVAVYEVTLP